MWQKRENFFTHSHTYICCHSTHTRRISHEYKEIERGGNCVLCANKIPDLMYLCLQIMRNVSVCEWQSIYVCMCALHSQQYHKQVVMHAYSAAVDASAVNKYSIKRQQAFHKFSSYSAHSLILLKGLHVCVHLPNDRCELYRRPYCGSLCESRFYHPSRNLSILQLCV